MKVRFVAGRVRVRLDDLELDALNGGQVLSTAVEWPGGGWQLHLDPQAAGLSGSAGRLRLGLAEVLADLNDPAQEGVVLAGPPQVRIEKDFGPQHA